MNVPLGQNVRAFDGTLGQRSSAPFQADDGMRQMVVTDDGKLVSFLVTDLQPITRCRCGIETIPEAPTYSSCYAAEQQEEFWAHAGPGGRF